MRECAHTLKNEKQSSKENGSNVMTDVSGKISIFV